MVVVGVLAYVGINTWLLNGRNVAKMTNRRHDRHILYNSLVYYMFYFRSLNENMAILRLQ